MIAELDYTAAMFFSGVLRQIGLRVWWVRAGNNTRADRFAVSLSEYDARVWARRHS